MEFNEELLDNLAKYGMSLEQYSLSAIGSASDAGRVLGAFRVLGKIKPVSEIAFKKQQEVLGRESWFTKFSKRVEGTAKGSMVSALSTASRNFYSLGIRAPMESLYSMVDNAIVQGEKGTGPLRDTMAKANGHLRRTERPESSAIRSYPKAVARGRWEIG